MSICRIAQTEKEAKEKRNSDVSGICNTSTNKQKILTNQNLDER